MAGPTLLWRTDSHPHHHVVAIHGAHDPQARLLHLQSRKSHPAPLVALRHQLHVEARSRHGDRAQHLRLGQEPARAVRRAPSIRPERGIARQRLVGQEALHVELARVGAKDVPVEEHLPVRDDDAPALAQELAADRDIRRHVAHRDRRRDEPQDLVVEGDQQRTCRRQLVRTRSG